jgi:molybdopterin-biosynthesis enzyme MoeA-like protein
MSAKGLFLQNVIAVIWDFDKTLSPFYMQKPLFEAYDIDEDVFWREVNGLPAFYEKAGIRVPRDTCYLGHLLSYSKSGRMPGLNNARLRELGANITFFPGIPEIFDNLMRVVAKPVFREGDLRLEHYVVSTGLLEMVRGSKINDKLAGIWASEFIEEPAGPGYDVNDCPKAGAISQIAGFLDNTTKTRALFEINKGVNKEKSITVNDYIPEEERRVPFKNMIYVADGPSDIPSFSVIKKHGGLTFAVYDPNSKEHYKQVLSLHENGRVEHFGAADYREGTETDRWLQAHVERIAERMMDERKRATSSKVSKEPTHISTLGRDSG